MTLVRLFIGALGAVAIGIGAVLLAVAAGLMAWVGSGDTVYIPEVRVATTDGMVLAEDIDFLFESEARFVPDLGTATLRIRSADGGDVFAGVTDRLTADRFLTDDSDLDRQAFWLASDRGASADLSWDIRPGNWTFVVAGEDGTAPSEILIDGELAATPFRLAAGTVGAVGIGAGLAGALLLVVAFGLTGRPPTGGRPSDPEPGRIPLGATA